MGQTYPLPDVGEEWAEHHVAGQDQRVGPYPEALASTLPSERAVSTVPRRAAPTATATATATHHTSTRPNRCALPMTAGLSRLQSGRKTTIARRSARWRSTTSHRRRPSSIPPAAPSGGAPADACPNRARPTTDVPPSDTLRELAFPDPINEIGPADQLDGLARLPRLYDEDFTILALLDRVGLAPASLIGRAALPGRAPRTVADRLVKLYRHGLVARHTTGLRQHT